MILDTDAALTLAPVVFDLGEHFSCSKANAADVFNEDFFGLFGVPATLQGWSVYPQQRGEQRKPVHMPDDMQPIRWTEFQERAPNVELVRQWGERAPADNLAVVLGRASGNVFAIDIDVLERGLSEAVEDLAYEVLGRTPFKRVGKWPKSMLFYRTTADELPPFRRFVFVGEDGVSPSDHAIEILGQGRSVTAFGRHHETSRMFEWVGARSPVSGTPEHVPLITAEQIETFVERVHEIRAFHRNRAVGDFVVDFTDAGDGTIRVPRLNPTGASWTVRNFDGKVADGREAFLFSLCYAAAKANPASCTTAGGVASIVIETVKAFVDRTVPSPRWLLSKVQADARDKIRRVARKVASGEIAPSTGRASTWTVPERTKISVPDRYVDVDALLRHLPRARTALANLGYDDTSLVDPSTLALAANVGPDSARVGEETTAALREILFELLRADPDAPAPAYVAKVPTGGGKTSRLVELLGEISSEWSERLGVMLATPTHANADEVLERAEAEGLNAMVYRGKLRDMPDGSPMCLRRDVVEPLQAAGVGTSNVCEAIVKDTTSETGKRTIRCPFFDECAYQKQQETALTADLVIVPHAYIGLGDRLPKALQGVTAVVIDESIVSTVHHTAQMPISTLEIPRKPPRPTKKERAAGVQADDLLADRADAVSIVLPALRADRDPAVAIYDEMHARAMKPWSYRREGPNAVEAARIMIDADAAGLVVIQSAIAVTGRTERLEATITPLITASQIPELTSGLKGSHIREEWRFWRLLEERYIARRTDRFVETTNGNDVRVATGETDARVRRVRKTLRMSWISTPALSELPVLHMDASAEPQVVQRIVGRKVTVREIAAPIRQVTVLVPSATFSKSSLLAREDEDFDKLARKGKIIARMREAIASICMRHSHGDVVIVCPLRLEEHLTSLGHWPTNLRWMHFGATRGLDYAKDSVAMITIGDLNARLVDYDDIVAAMSCNNQIPDSPMVDADGAEPGYRVVRERIQMRDGRTAILDVHRLEGERAATAQRMVRDHELLQSWGRLRPVHRSTPGVVYHLGRTVPAGTIVDRIIHFDDLIRGDAQIATALTETAGVLGEDVIADLALPNAQAQFDALAKRIESEPDAFEGLRVARDGYGTRAIVARSADHDAALREGWEYEPFAVVERVETDADRKRRERELALRDAAIVAYEEELKVVGRYNLKWANGIASFDNGVDGLGRYVYGTLRETLEICRPSVLPALTAPAD